MATTGLTAFWIKSPRPTGPLGFGVTARCLDDALRIIKVLGYAPYLPEGPGLLAVKCGVTFADLDDPHVITHMGPMVVRGMWYPFVVVGMPTWAEELATKAKHASAPIAAQR